MRPPNFLIRWLASRHHKKINLINQKPWQTQLKTLQKILSQFRDTEWEHHFNLHKVNNYHDLDRLIPNTQDTYYEAMLQEILATNKAELIETSSLAYMAKTSGSTSKSKYIPYPSGLIKNFQRFSFDVFLHFSYTHNCFDVMQGNILVSPSNLNTETSQHGLQIGTGTGIMTKLAPRLSRRIVKPSDQNLNHKSFQEKIEAMINEAYPLDIRSFTCAPAFALPILEHLFNTAKRSGKEVTSIHQIWPNLQFYIFSGTSVAPYKKRLQHYLGGNIPFLEVYSSTESPFAYQWDPNIPDELYLDLESCFYFFQREGSPPESERLTVEDVQIGQRYRLLITTYGGLINYEIGDTVQIVKRTPLIIKVIGREKEEVNMVGLERISLATVHDHLQSVFNKFHLNITQYFLAPYYVKEKPGYLWCFEYHEDISNNHDLLQALDDNLMSLNSGYKMSRDCDVRLLKPRVQIIPPNSIRQFILENKEFGQGKFLTVHNTDTDVINFFEWLKKKAP